MSATAARSNRGSQAERHSAAGIARCGSRVRNHARSSTLGWGSQLVRRGFKQHRSSRLRCRNPRHRRSGECCRPPASIVLAIEPAVPQEHVPGAEARDRNDQACGDGSVPSTRRTVVLDNSNSECQTCASPNLPLFGCAMRIVLLLFAVLLMVVPATARSRGGYGRSSSSRSYSGHSSRSRSYHPRSSASSSRSHSPSGHAYRSHPAHNSSHSSGTVTHRSRQTSSNGTVQRDGQGKIKRSAAAKDAFKRQQPCPSTGKSRGACPGYVIDHVKPLECGGADAPQTCNGRQWQQGKQRTKLRRYCR